MNELERALAEVVSFLKDKKIPYMVIGGIANLVWGVPRSTQDVDVSVWLGNVSTDRLIGLCRKRFQFRTANPGKFAEETFVIPLQTKDGTAIDLILAQLDFERKAMDRAISKRFQGIFMKVCSPEDLIVLKIISERTKDREDVRGIIQKSAKQIDRQYLESRIKELATALSRPDILRFFRSCW